MKNLLLNFSLMLLFVGAAMAQDRTVTGTVSDENGDPLTGATVSEQNTTNGTITDMDGNYKISVGGSAKLVFSFIGYQTMTVDVGNRSKIDVTLQTDVNELEEIVVTALGIEQEKRSLGYAVSEVSGKDMTQAGQPSIGTALYGKAAGVQITNTSGGPTAGTNIVIRGNNSIMYNNRPLVVVDGIPIEDKDSQYGRWGGSDPGTGINDLNPEDIESLEVLKGSNAAALYGSRAANGVILITTKRGKKSKGLGLDFSTNYTMDNIAFTPEYQNEFGAGYGRDYAGFPYIANDGTLVEFRHVDADGNTVAHDAPGAIPTYSSNWASFGPRMNGQMIRWWDGEMRPYSPQPNNYADLFKSGSTGTTSLAFSNSTDRGSFRFAYTNYDYDGTWHETSQQRNTLSLNSNLKISDKVSADVSMSYMDIWTHNRPPRLSGLVGYEFPRSTKTDLIFANYKDDQGYRVTNDKAPFSSSRNMMNVLWNSFENSNDEFKDRLIGNVTLNYNITDWLKFRTKIGSDFSTQWNENKNKSTRPAADGPSGAYNTRKTQLKDNYMDAILTFAKDFSSDISVSWNVGGRAMYTETSTVFSGTNGGLVVENWFSITNSQNQAGTNANRSMQRTDAIMTFGQVAWRNQLFLDLTGTQEWTSTLPVESNDYFYPSASLAWVFSDTYSMPSFLNYGKFRASLAKVSNGAPNYLANATYGYGNWNGVTVNSFSSSVPPQGLRPETQTSFEIGTELRALDNKLSLDLNYYKNNNFDQIMPLSVAASTGAGSVIVNAGETQNQGLEVQLNYTAVQTSDMQLNFGFNWAKNQNKIIELAKGIESIRTSDFNYPMYQEAREGEPMGAFVTFPYERDEAGNKVIDASGFPIRSSDAEVVGNATPDWIGGLITNFSWKGIYFNALIDMKMGGDMFSFTNFYGVGAGKVVQSLPGREGHGGLPYYEDDNGVYQQIAAGSTVGPNGNPVYNDGMIIEGVTESGEPNSQIIPAANYYIDAYYWNYGFHEEGLFDNSYVKFREASISYQFPKSLIGTKVFQNLTVSLIGRNLFYLYRSIPNIDPESSLGTNRNTAAQEYGAYPSTRSYGFSIRAGF